MASSKTMNRNSNARTLNVVNTAFFLVEHTIAGYALKTLWEQGTMNMNTFYLLSAFYFITVFSISAGYHRLYAHGSYQAVGLFKFLVLLIGSGAFLGPVTKWCRYHRAHHRFINKERDPMNINKGFFHAHMGWYLMDDQTLEKEVDTNDIQKDFWASFQTKFYLLLAVFTAFLWPATIAGLWGDSWGGFLYAGVLRVVLVQHAFFCTTSLSHIFGTQKYSNENSSRNNLFVSLITLGEGYQNFNHNFPKDYRMGAKFYDFDPIKFVIAGLSAIGITYDLKATKMLDIKKAHLLFKQSILDKKKSGLDFGTDEEKLPILTWAQVDAKTAKGDRLVVIDGIVHDVSKFNKVHPGGIKILERRVGKDATVAFNGGLYRHSKAARNILATLRIARLSKDEVHSRTQSDFFKNEDEDY